MNEFQWINKIKPKYYRQPIVQKGVGDDAAVCNLSNESLVTAVDMFVENTHFKRETMAPWQIGYKSLAANLSDMAAMGATPVSYLVAIALADSWTTAEIEEIFSGMKYLADQFNLDLIGGDTVSGERLTISITIIGKVNQHKARYRHLAKENDVVFVTGTLGDSRAGFHLLNNVDRPYIKKDYFIGRHQQPTARVDFSKALSNIPRIALNDISDGIANEAIEIAESSGVSLHLKAEKIPTHPDFQQFTVDQQFKWTYFGGEDFELIGTVSKQHWSEVQEVANETNTLVTKIGNAKMSAPGKVFLYQEDKHPIILPKEGYIHLA